MPQQTSKQYFTTLKLLFFALFIGQLSFLLIALYLVINNKFSGDPTLKDSFIYIVPAFMVGAIFIGQVIYKSHLTKLKQKNTLIEKMNGYKIALIIRLALLEGATLFSLIVYLLTSEVTFVAMAIIGLAYFLLLIPAANKIAVDLELNGDDRSKIDNPNEIIASTQSR